MFARISINQLISDPPADSPEPPSPGAPEHQQQLQQQTTKLPLSSTHIRLRALPHDGSVSVSSQHQHYDAAATLSAAATLVAAATGYSSAPHQSETSTATALTPFEPDRPTLPCVSSLLSSSALDYPHSPARYHNQHQHHHHRPPLTTSRPLITSAVDHHHHQPHHAPPAPAAASPAATTSHAPAAADSASVRPFYAFNRPSYDLMLNALVSDVSPDQQTIVAADPLNALSNKRWKRLLGNLKVVSMAVLVDPVTSELVGVEGMAAEVNASSSSSKANRRARQAEDDAYGEVSPSSGAGPDRSHDTLGDHHSSDDRRFSPYRKPRSATYRGESISPPPPLPLHHPSYPATSTDDYDPSDVLVQADTSTTYRPPVLVYQKRLVWKSCPFNLVLIPQEDWHNVFRHIHLERDAAGKVHHIRIQKCLEKLINVYQYRRSRCGFTIDTFRKMYSECECQQSTAGSVEARFAHVPTVAAPAAAAAAHSESSTMVPPPLPSQSRRDRRMARDSAALLSLSSPSSSSAPPPTHHMNPHLQSRHAAYIQQGGFGVNAAPHSEHSSYVRSIPGGLQPMHI
ncbi:hypothetical protein RI367_006734 [Sorochytrium milnesiophthora]